MSEPELYRILCAYFAEWYPGVIPERIVITDTTGKKYAMTVPLAVRPGFAKPEVKKVYTTSEPEESKPRPRQTIRDAVIKMLLESPKRLTGKQIAERLMDEHGGAGMGWGEETINRAIRELKEEGEINNVRKASEKAVGLGFGIVGQLDDFVSDE